MIWIFGSVVLLLIGLRQAVLTLVAASVLLLYALYMEGHAEYAIYDLWRALNNETLLLLPLFALTGTLMAAGESIQKLMTLFELLAGHRPAGAAMISLIAMVVAAALCGSSMMALLVFGPALLEVMQRASLGRYFSIGLLCAAACVGFLLPLSLAPALYSSLGSLDPGPLYVTAARVGIVLVVLLGLYVLLCTWSLVGEKTQRPAFWPTVSKALPVIVLFSGFVAAVSSPLLSITHSAALYLLAVLLLEATVYRSLDFSKLDRLLREVAVQLGRILPLLGFGWSLGVFLRQQGLPENIDFWLGHYALDSGMFLGLANMLVLVVGLFLDGLSALAVVTPVLVPLAEGQNLAGEAFGVMVLANLSVSYLMPPNGLILIAAMAAFRESFATVLASVAPFIVVFWLVIVGCALVTLSV